jgi:hypothetical protein
MMAFCSFHFSSCAQAGSYHSSSCTQATWLTSRQQLCVLANLISAAVQAGFLYSAAAVYAGSFHISSCLCKLACLTGTALL